MLVIYLFWFDLEFSIHYALFWVLLYAKPKQHDKEHSYALIVHLYNQTVNEKSDFTGGFVRGALFFHFFSMLCIEWNDTRCVALLSTGCVQSKAKWYNKKKTLKGCQWPINWWSKLLLKRKKRRKNVIGRLFFRVEKVAQHSTDRIWILLRELTFRIMKEYRG